MNKSDMALERVQNLYLVQMDLIRALTSDLSDPRERKEVRTKMKQFEGLLQMADHRYMGGEDVLEGLRSLPLEMAQKLKQSPVAVAKLKAVRRR